jgi:hypothetical protein
MGGGVRDDKLYIFSSLGSIGLAPAQAKTFLASSLLAILETNTEADTVVPVAGGVVAALS